MFLSPSKPNQQQSYIVMNLQEISSSNITTTFQKQDLTMLSEQAQSIPGAGLSIVFIFGGLLYSGLIKMLSRSIKIPLNPLLLISGIALGGFHQQLGFVGKSAYFISQLNPNGILALFLPTLIFQSAFQLEWHMMKKQMEQMLILGGPCVILSSIMIMSGVKLILGYDQSSYTWLQAFLLGCILCCTDIFSFANKLKQYGTSQRIISLIQGESLFNYCSCVLIFQIINEVVIDYEGYSILWLGTLFVQETFGGILFGLFFGAIALFIVKRIIQDGILVVTIMVIFCYAIYLTCQFTEIRVSGIIALVTFGIFMNAFGKPRIIGQTAKYMSSFWSYTVFIAESSIFLIAGVLVGVNVFHIEGLMTTTQFTNIFILYLLVMISRYLSFLCFHKLVSKLGYGMQWKQTIIIAFGGLKGAVAISFAMIIFENDSYTIKTSNYFLFHVTTNSLLTLLINGMTSWMVIKALRMSNITKVQYIFFKEYIEEFRSRIEDKKQELKGQRFLDAMKWDEEIDEKVGVNDLKNASIEVEKTISEIKDGNVSDFEKKRFYSLEDALKQFANRHNPTDNMAENQLKKQNERHHIVIELRKRFIKSFKYKLWSFHQEYKTKSEAVMLLIQAANFDLDTHTQELESWSWIKNQFSSNIRFVSEMRKYYIVGSFARDYLFNYISYCYDVVSSYIQANQQVREEFRQGNFVGKGQYQNAMALILGESQENQKEAQNFLQNYLKPSFPEIQKEVKTSKATFGLLFSFSNIVNRFNETGLLDQNEYDMLDNLISKKKLSLQLQNPSWKTHPLKQYLKNDNVFGLLPQKILSVIQDQLIAMDTFDSNEIIQTNSSIAKHIYFIRRGGCTIQYINGSQIYKQSLKVDDIYGIQSMISPVFHSIVTANTLMVVVSLKKNHIQKIMDYFFDFQEAFWKRYLYVLLRMMTINKDFIYYLFSHASRAEVQEIILKNFRLKRVEPGDFPIEDDVIFMRGHVQMYNQQEERYARVAPMTMFLSKDKDQVRVIERSSFMIGSLPLQKIQNELFSPTSLKKKSSKVYIDTPLRSISKIPKDNLLLRGS